MDDIDNHKSTALREAMRSVGAQNCSARLLAYLCQAQDVLSEAHAHAMPPLTASQPCFPHPQDVNAPTSAPDMLPYK
jgi:hypothetical protein